MNHPCKVYYPYGGHHYLVQWWTHNLQSMMILSRSKSALDQTVQKAIHHFGEKDEIQIREGIEIDIVGPSENLIKKSTERARKQEIHNFVINVLCQVSSELRLNRALPPIFSQCSARNHDYCGDDVCILGLSLNISKEDLYDKYHTAWNETVGLRPYVCKKEQYSRARQASNEERIWFASNKGFSSGVEVFQVEVDCEPTSPVNFYFVKLNELDITEYQKQVSSLEEEKKKKREQQRERFQKRAESQHSEMLDKIWKVFG